MTELKTRYDSYKAAVRAATTTEQAQAISAGMGDYLADHGHQLRRLDSNASEREIRTAGGQYVEGWANLLDGMAERLEREAQEAEIRQRTAREWRLLERGYIVRSRYTLLDFYDDYVTMIEDGDHTWANYTAERKRWRKCKHRFCLNVFPTDKDHFHQQRAGAAWNGRHKRKDSRFCCDACRTEHRDAVKQYRRTASMYDNPTYLPQAIINDELKLDASKDRAFRRNEITYEADNVESLDTGAMEYEAMYRVDESDYWFGGVETYSIDEFIEKRRHEAV